MKNVFTSTMKTFQTQYYKHLVLKVLKMYLHLLTRETKLGLISPLFYFMYNGKEKFKFGIHE